MRLTPWLLPLFILLLQGCSSKYYYTLGDTSDITMSQTYTKSIAVEKIQIPKYLKDNNLVRQVTPYQIILIKEANWLTPMQRRLTNVLINYLQKSLNNPNVYLFPWETEKETDKKLSVKIKRLIAYKDEVRLDASYKIRDLKTNQYTTKLFSTIVPTSETTDAMVASMEKAYFQLIEAIKAELIKNEFD
ncbi:MAG TPA: membrane integrity-associated transporter subunit PqiC [Campylobacterales bacterium]|nr:membrane integrity-associated transporter subunit PqiC [Campylobacterales bacterium]HHS93298.1 membrane integrity-associated transporter subunit PqiC [Campylobacterales bacterium]